jgi:L,D-peptidoglycan transpeptidase YkuD (ErfK/YbiS/YcfS/YnhG family)
MWRADGLYDVVVVLDYNLQPRAMGRGSAIFLHCARDGYAPTEGCVAVERGELVRLLAHASTVSAITTAGRSRSK